MKTRTKITVGAGTILLISLIFLLPAISSAQLNDPTVPDLSVPDLSGIPLTSQPSSQTNGANTGTTPGYGGYANGSDAQVNLPFDQGTVDVGLSSGEINSSGGIVPDWPGTPQDESKSTSVGIVEALGIHNTILDDESLGSAGSSFAPATGIVGSVQDLFIPGVGDILLASYRTESRDGFTDNEMTVTQVTLTAQGITILIPVGQSSATSQKTGNKVTSDSSSNLLGGSSQPIITGGPLDPLSPTISIMSSSSHSEADGNVANSQNSWQVAFLSLGGIPLVVVDSDSGAVLGGVTLIPAGNGSFIAVAPAPGIAGVFIGETWSDTDGKTFAFGGANAMRVSLLNDPNFIILGHSGTGANSAFSNGPGSGPNQVNEGNGNLPPDIVGSPNDRPIGQPPGAVLGEEIPPTNGGGNSNIQGVSNNLRRAVAAKTAQPVTSRAALPKTGADLLTRAILLAAIIALTGLATAAWMITKPKRIKSRINR